MEPVRTWWRALRTKSPAVVAAAVCLLATGCANGVFYQPDSFRYGEPRELGAKVEEVKIPSSDGLALDGWFLHPPGQTRGTIVYFHGNAQNITAWVHAVGWLARAGYQVLLFDYRGYGQSPGKPTREGLQQDGLAVLRYARSRGDVDPDRIVVYGQSLGGAVALPVVVASGTPVRAVVVESAFSSYRQRGREALAGIPGSFLFKWPLSWMLISGSHDPVKAIPKLAPCPVLIIHGTADRVVDVSHARTLYEAAREPKELWLVPGGRHVAAMAPANSPWRQRLLDYLDGVLAAPAPGD